MICSTSQTGCKSVQGFENRICLADRLDGERSIFGLSTDLRRIAENSCGVSYKTFRSGWCNHHPLIPEKYDGHVSIDVKPMTPLTCAKRHRVVIFLQVSGKVGEAMPQVELQSTGNHTCPSREDCFAQQSIHQSFGDWGSGIYRQPPGGLSARF